MRTTLLPAIVMVCIAAGAYGAKPTTKPGGDAAVDWLFGQAQDAPATRPDETDEHLPASRPASPLDVKMDDDTRTGTLTMSDGEKISGHFSHTQDKPLRVWVESEKQYRDIQFSHVKSLEARVLWERQQEEWHFKSSGSDIKEFSGKTYPARETEYVVTLIDGEKITGALDEPLYQTAGDARKTYILYKRSKGEVGQSLGQLIYVKKAEFDDPPAKPKRHKKPATMPG